MADALTVEDKTHKFRSTNQTAAKKDMRTAAGRREALKDKRKKTKGWQKSWGSRG